MPACTWGKGSTSVCQDWAGGLVCTPCTSPHGPLAGGVGCNRSHPSHFTVRSSWRVREINFFPERWSLRKPCGASIVQCAGMLHFYVENNVCVFDALQESRPCSSLQKLRQDGGASCPCPVPVVTVSHISHPIETKEVLLWGWSR